MRSNIILKRCSWYSTGSVKGTKKFIVTFFLATIKTFQIFWLFDYLVRVFIFAVKSVIINFFIIFNVGVKWKTRLTDSEQLKRYSPILPVNLA